MNPRALAALLVPLALVASGCINAATDEPLAPGAAATGLALPSLPAGVEPFTQLLCSGDRLVPLDGDHAADCNYRATHDSGPAAEVHLAVNPTNPLNLVGGSKDFTLGEDEKCGKYNVWSGVYVTFDGGRTWEHSLLPGYPGDSRATALSAYGCGSDPVIAFGPEGNVYYSSIHYTEDVTAEGAPLPQLGPFWGYPVMNAGMALTRSRDGGRTWDDPVLMVHKEDGGIIDKQWLAVDMATGQIYVTGIDTSRGEFLAWRSDDQGQTWTTPVVIAARGQDGAEAVQFGQVAVAPDGVVHFTYWMETEGGFASGIYHKSSADKAQTWSAPTKIADFRPVFDLEFTHKYRIVPNPALAADPQTGALYVSYPDRVQQTQAHVRPDLDHFVVASTDGGKTWTMPVRVNDDLPIPTNGQWMTAIAVGPESTVHSTWLDYRDDPTGASAYVYYAYSKDGGKTWSKNVRVSDVPFDGTGGYHQSGAGTIGDYMGLAVTRDAVFPFWADTRDSRNDVFSAVILAR